MQRQRVRLVLFASYLLFDGILLPLGNATAVIACAIRSAFWGAGPLIG